MNARMHWGLVVAGVLLAPRAIAAPTAAEYRQMGLQFRNQERYTNAIAALQKALELEPDNVSGRVLLGWTQHKASQRVEAAETLTQAFYLNPFDVPTLNALGIVQLVEGKLGSAIASHGWAAVLKANNEIAYYNLSLAFERIGQYDWAIAAAKKAATLEPNNPHPLVAEAIAHWGNGEKEQAQKAYQLAQRLNGAYADSGYLAIDLPRAGFSETQLATSQQIRKSL